MFAAGRLFVEVAVVVTAATKGLDLGPIIVALIAAAAGAAGVLLTLGPRRKSIITEATDQAVETMSKVNEALSRRLDEAEAELARYKDQLGTADKRIFRLEGDLRQAQRENSETRAAYETRLAEARRKREELEDTVNRLQAEVAELRQTTQPEGDHQ